MYPYRYRPASSNSALKDFILPKLIVLVSCIVFVILVAPPQVYASTLTVNTFSDELIAGNGECSLREAIINTNTDVDQSDGDCAVGDGHDVIQLGAGVYTLSIPAEEDGIEMGDLDIGDDLTIVGMGAENTTIDASELGDRVFDVAANLTVRNLTVTGGFTYSNGGAFLVGEANLSIYDSVLAHNTAKGFGGAIKTVAGSVTVQDSVLAHNVSSTGGGAAVVYGGAQMDVMNTAVLNNSAGHDGLGIETYGGGYNTYGGAIYVNYGSTLNVTNATLSGNFADFGGGAIYNDGVLNLLHVTVVENQAGIAGGALLNEGSGTIGSSIIVGNQASEGSPDCEDYSEGGLISHGFNLLSDYTNCPVDEGETDLFISSGDLFETVLDGLADNGGLGATYATLPDSPALNVANEAACPNTDQRGILRPQGSGCEIGAFELEEDSGQTGPFFVNTSDDIDDEVCDFDHCSLREAIHAANNIDGKDTIYFDTVAMESNVINVESALPEIVQPVIIDGRGYEGELTAGFANETQMLLSETAVTIDGSDASEETDGFVIIAGDSEIHDLVITNFAGNGVVIAEAGGNWIYHNEITGNGQNGVLVLSSTANRINNNEIYDNGLLGIDLDGDGPTLNDANDPDGGANNAQNFPQILRATPSDGGTFIEGSFNSTPDTEFLLEFFLNESCDATGFGEGRHRFGSAIVITDEGGNAELGAYIEQDLPLGSFITATATDENHNTSEFSECSIVSLDNDAWITALRLPLLPDPVDEDVFIGSISQYLDKEDQSRWYKFQVEPNSELIVTLTNLPENYDLTIYRDIAQTYNEITTLNDEDDLTELTAEFAPDAYSPDAYSPDAYSPDAYSPDAYSPDAYSPDAYSPDAYSPDAYSPDAYSPDAYSPDAYSPDAYSPDAYSPDAYSPDAYSPDAYSPDAYSPDAYSSAQTRSLIGVSAFNGNAGEGIRLNTWENSGDFYVRVRGRNGVFSLQQPFDLEVQLMTGNCSEIDPLLPASSLTSDANGYETIILTDMARMEGTTEEIATLQARLATLAARSDVNGVIVDVGSDTAVSFANTQADAYPACPFAKNMVAHAIKNIVDGYWELNPTLQYVVIVGNDDTIPFFRHPDQALLANERNYVPPVRDNTASQASLKLGYVLSQDLYGARTQLNRGVRELPIPELGVGRLVETAVDATGVVDAYLATGSGVVPTPASSLVTGYDFLEDAALEVARELQTGTGVTPSMLITPRDVSPEEVRPYPDDPTVPGDDLSWTADHLRDEFLGNDNDIVFLAGHFSASSALAADYDSRLLASELAASDVDLVNAIVFSAGCHSGYNIVNDHGIPGITPEPDWAQAFAQKQALLIAGTGYQYGDTDFIEYSERLYLEFSEQLRAGTGAVSVGEAMVRAKQVYLAETPELRPIHEKALLEATIFGLPMLSVDMPQGRGSSAGLPTNITPAPVATNPGVALNLHIADLNITPSLTPTEVELDVIGGEEGETVTTTYLTGGDRLSTNPGELVLPVIVEDVTATDFVLRGVGFRGGSYADLANIIPLTGAPTTEIRGVHIPFYANVFSPIEFAQANYFDVLAKGFGNGRTRLNITPAQFISNGPATLDGTFRHFSSMDFRLFYSDYITSFESGNAPAQAAPLTISGIQTRVAGANVEVRARVYGDPAAGVQEVWVTFTGVDGTYYGQWQSVLLTQSTEDSTVWTGSFPLNGSSPEDIRMMFQAVNGVGLVSLATNLGKYYKPTAADPVDPVATTLQLLDPPTSGEFGGTTTVAAQLMADGQPLEGHLVGFELGSQRRGGVTNANGVAQVEIGIPGLIGTVDLRTGFAGTDEYLPSFDISDFTITPQATSLVFEPEDVTVWAGESAQMLVSLTGINGRPLTQSTVVLVITGEEETKAISAITNNSGRVPIDVTLPLGEYTIEAFFASKLELPQGNFDLTDERYQPASAIGTITVIEEPAEDDPVIYVSVKQAGRLGGVKFKPEDILAFDTVDKTWSMFFDGSDVGLRGKNVDAFVILDDDSLLISTSSPVKLPGLGKVDDSDILRFVPTSLGEDTSGTFEWYFDGSDVGLTKGGEDIDGLTVLEDGRLLISTTGNAYVKGVVAKDEDMIIFTPTTLGANTSGSWELAFDGSDIGLKKGSEDINGISGDVSNGELFFTTFGYFQAQDVGGNGADIVLCTPDSLGENTACQLEIYWNAHKNECWGKIIDAIHVQK